MKCSWAAVRSLRVLPARFAANSVGVTSPMLLGVNLQSAASTRGAARGHPAASPPSGRLSQYWTVRSATPVASTMSRMRRSLKSRDSRSRSAMSPHSSSRSSYSLNGSAPSLSRPGLFLSQSRSLLADIADAGRSHGELTEQTESESRAVSANRPRACGVPDGALCGRLVRVAAPRSKLVEYRRPLRASGRRSPQRTRRPARRSLESTAVPCDSGNASPRTRAMGRAHRRTRLDVRSDRRAAQLGTRDASIWSMSEETPSSLQRDTAPDGSPVVLYRRLPPGDTPNIIDSAIPRNSDILEIGAGAGRITKPLVERGHTVVAVDQSAQMLAWIEDAERVCADIEKLDLHRQFGVVLLASHLINTPDDEQRGAFLATCRRHVRQDGVVLIERHEPGWDLSASEGSSEQNGIRMALTEVIRHPPYVSAVMVYQIDGSVFRQPFTARVLDDEALGEELRRARLRLDKCLDKHWVVARPESD